MRGAFFTTDAEDNASFDDKGFATVTLLSSKRFAPSLDSQKVGDDVKGEEKFVVGPVSCVELPSVFGRDGLCVDIIPPSDPDTYYCLINVHLDSLKNLHTQTGQLEILANSLHEPGCSGGLIAGNFNSINPGDAELIDKNGWANAWLALHGRTDPEGPMWGVGRIRVHGLNPRRLDNVALMGWMPEEIEILHLYQVEILYLLN